MNNNDFINRKQLIEVAKAYDLVWLGEIHGIIENYKAYKEIIPILKEGGFSNILWEMSSDLDEKSTNSEDGRINPFAISFLKWIHEETRLKNIDRLVFFGDQTKSEITYSNNEERMSVQAIKALDTFNKKKVIVITGNFHMGGPLNVERKIEPCLSYVEHSTHLKILRIALKYSGGYLYNFGMKKMGNNFYFGDMQNLEFGTMILDPEKNTIFFHVGEAHAVLKNPTI